MAALGGMNSPDPDDPDDPDDPKLLLAASISMTSGRENHLASDSSSWSMVILEDVAWAMQPIMSWEGWGQGWEEW